MNTLAALAAAVLALAPSPAVPGTPQLPPLEQLGSGSCSPPATVPAREPGWAQQRVAAERVWPVTRGAGVKVAVVDSGVDAGHPQLAGRVAEGYDVLHQKKGADTDCVGHGTFVAGIIAAAPADGITFAGVAPEAEILPYRQNDIDSGGTALGVAEAIGEAVSDGATVVNISVAAVHSSPALAAAVADAERNDVLIVAAVANEAANGNPTAYPAAYPTVLGVGAVDRAGARAQFSGVGDFVDLTAPGVDVISTGPNGPGHLTASGTSFATPYVAGVAALVRAHHPDLTAAQVRHRMQATADAPGRRLPDRELGWGVVNAYAAVTAILPEEGGRRRVSAPPVVVPAAVVTPPLTPGARLALLVAAGAAVLTGGAAAGRVILIRGRRRRWRAAEPAGDDA